MKPQEIETPESFSAMLIAPCGVNCGRCIAHVREKRRCAGCNSTDGSKANHCATCRIKNCEESENGAQKFCFTCAKFPCARLRQPDKRYRQNYGMSIIENLERIRDFGLEEFVVREKIQAECPQCGGVTCVHRTDCIYCGYARETS